MKDELTERYQSLFGFVPENIKRRVVLSGMAERGRSVEIVEQLRQELIHNNPLETKVQQLVHFAMLVAKGEKEPAKLHVRGALRAGATPRELYGVCETAAIVGGMPSYSLAVDLVYDALIESGIITE